MKQLKVLKKIWRILRFWKKNWENEGYEIMRKEENYQKFWRNENFEKVEIKQKMKIIDTKL